MRYFYERLVDGLIAKGLTPWLCLYHCAFCRPVAAVLSSKSQVMGIDWTPATCSHTVKLDLSLKKTRLHGLMKQAKELRGPIVIVFPFFPRARP